MLLYVHLALTILARNVKNVQQAVTVRTVQLASHVHLAAMPVQLVKYNALDV